MEDLAGGNLRGRCNRREVRVVADMLPNPHRLRITQLLRRITAIRRERVIGRVRRVRLRVLVLSAPGVGLPPHGT